MTTERCNYRTRSVALDWGPLRENVERAGRGREPIQRLATVAPERGRSPSAETSYERGQRGCATLSRRAGNVAARVGAPRAATSHSPSPARYRHHPVLPLTVERAVVRRQWRRCRHSCNTSMMFRWFQSRTREWTLTHYPSNTGAQWQIQIKLPWIWMFLWIVKSDIFGFLRI